MAIVLPELSAESEHFPPADSALSQPDGLLAFGGDLSVNRLQAAYQQGIFPWFSEGDPLLWWSPATRAVFAPGSLRVNRSLQKAIRRQQLQFSCNLAFAEVIKGCADTRRDSGTWITDDIQQAYLALHQAGQAHSIEVWQRYQLVGGLYGVQVGQLFCGESMFNLEPNAAKAALVVLQQLLSQVGDGWIDCQMPNPFLLSQGAQPLPRASYLQLLADLKHKPVPAHFWRPRQLEFVR